MYTETRYLIVTADDFCCLPCIDSGSLFGVQKGLVNTLTAMTTYPGAAGIIRHAKETCPGVHIGLHLNITSGYALSPAASIPSLLDNDGQFYTINDILGRLGEISLPELETELRAQVNEFRKSGVELDHLTYQHNLLAMYPPFYELVINLAKEYKVPVRNPVSLSVIDRKRFPGAGTYKLAKKLAFNVAIRHPFKALGLLKYMKKEHMLLNHAKLDKAGIHYPTNTIDYIYGNPTQENLCYVLDNLPPGTSELIFHLGQGCSKESAGKGVDGDYFAPRELETKLATGNFFKTYIQKKNIELIHYSDLK